MMNTVNPKNHAPTIRAVASEAGVSVATVSAVINQTRFVSAETARRVNEAINAAATAPTGSLAVSAPGRQKPSALSCPPY